MAGLTLICSSNDDEVLNKNLLLSPCLARDHVQCLVQRGYLNTASAYNKAVLAAEHDLICFVQPDVLLPEGWDEALAAQVAAVERMDREWAVLGIAGALIEGETKRVMGHYRESGEEFGSADGLPAEVQSVDDLLIVCRRETALFDEWMPNPSLVGTELCLRMRREERRCYAIDAYCHHNPSGDRAKLPLDYLLSCGYLYARYPDMLPIVATRVTIQQIQGVCALTA
jgi:hypothetical protein